MPKKRYKAWLNALGLAVIFALTLWSVFKGENLAQMWAHIRSADALYLMPAVMCVVLFILGEATVIHCLLRSLGTVTRYFNCCLYSFIGFFYSCITPSASGGQPMQVIAMRKEEIPVAVSSVVLGIVTITYKLVLVVMGALVMLLRPARVMECLAPMENLVYLGMALNVVCITALLLIVFSPGPVTRFVHWCAKGIGRIRPFKNPGRMERKIEKMSGQYAGAAAYFRTHHGVIFKVFAITVAQRMMLFLVTWLVYRSLHLSGESFWVILALQAMISVAVDMLPLPGGMGASENLFLEIFLPVFGEALVLPGMVISRGISYYTQLLISAVMTIAATWLIRKKK